VYTVAQDENEALTPIEWMDYWAQFALAEARKAKRPFYLTGMRRAINLATPEHKHVIEHLDTYDYIDISQNSANVGQGHYDNAYRVWMTIRDKGARPINNVKIYKAGSHAPAEVFGGTWHDTQVIETGCKFFRNLFAGCASSRFHRPVLSKDRINFGVGLSPMAQAHIRSARLLFDAVHIFTMVPRNDLLSDRAENGAYCLAEVGKQYVVYFPAEGSVTIELSEVAGELKARWLNLDSYNWEPEQKITVCGRVTLTTPKGGQWAVVLLPSDGGK